MTTIKKTPAVLEHYQKLLDSQTTIYEYFLEAITEVDSYTKHREVFAVPICTFLVVQNKLEHARTFSLTINNILRQLRIMLSQSIVKTQEIEQQFVLLKTLYSKVLLQHMDELLLLMGATGYMSENPVCKIWERLYAELY